MLDLFVKGPLLGGIRGPLKKAILEQDLTDEVPQGMDEILPARTWRKLRISGAKNPPMHQ